MNLSLHHKKYILAGIFIIPLVVLYIFKGPITQNQAYHSFADTDLLLGIPNFHNVFSNLLFLIFPVIGFKQYLSNKKAYSLSWLVFIFGVLIVAPGSAYYHLSPNDGTLIWDRLPMTIAFMGLTSFVFTEVFNIKKELLFQIILILIGVYSIVHWVFFNDLRIYAWVQLTPIIGILFIAFALPTKSLRPRYLLVAIGFYLAAKITEFYDKDIHQALGYSGHSIKHVLASFTVYTLMLMKRKTIEKNV